MEEGNKKQINEYDNYLPLANIGRIIKNNLTKDVKLTKSALKKAFGKKFNNIGVVHNEEGSYLILADEDGNFKHISCS